MAYDHNFPAVLNPVGDYCVPLFIPLHPDYTALLLGVIGTLEDTTRYERDPNFDDEDAKIVVAQWRDRTITPLINAIATAIACGGHMNAKLLTGTQINYTTTATTYTATGLSISYTPTKANALIKAYLPILNNSGSVIANHQVRFDGNVGAVDMPSIVLVGVMQNIVAAAIFNGLTVGVAKNVQVYAKVSAGSTDIRGGAGTNYFIEILEFD